MSIHDINHVIAVVRGEEAAQLFRELVRPGEAERPLADCAIFRMSRTSLEEAKEAAKEVHETYPDTIRALGTESQLMHATRIAVLEKFS